MKEKPSILLATPHNRDIEPEYMTSVIGMLRHMQGKADIKVLLYESPMVISARNWFAEKCRADYLFFIDSDMAFPETTLEKLLSLNKDIVSALYYKRNNPHTPIVYRYKKKIWFHQIELDEIPNKPFKCDGIGMGLCLIKGEVLKKVKEDYKEEPFNLFTTFKGNQIGEDLSFCKRAKSSGFEIWCDPTIATGHVSTEVVKKRHSLAAKKVKDMEEKQYPYNNDIPGWMSRKELNWLLNTARQCDNFVEVGSWKGRSTHAILTGCNGDVWAIDHFKGSKEEVEHQEAKEKDIYKEFKKNVGKFNNLKTLKMTSLEAAKKFKKDSVDAVFIDGEHTYNSVKADIKAWLPKATKIICGHDYNWPSVRKAVKETLGKVETFQSIWFKFL